MMHKTKIFHAGHGRPEEEVERIVRFATSGLSLPSGTLPVRVTHGRFNGGGGLEFDVGYFYHYRAHWARSVRRHLGCSIMVRVPSDEWPLYGRPKVCYHSKEALEAVRMSGVGWEENPAAEMAYAEGRRTVGQWPVYIVNDWQEALVRITAHEFMHAVQMFRRKGSSEVACERYASFVLDEWRAGLTAADSRR